MPKSSRHLQIIKQSRKEIERDRNKRRVVEKEGERSFVVDTKNAYLGVAQRQVSEASKSLAFEEHEEMLKFFYYGISVPFFINKRRVMRFVSMKAYHQFSKRLDDIVLEVNKSHFSL